MPKFKALEIHCSCGKLLATNIDATGTIELYCKGCKQVKLIKLSLN